MDDKVTAVLDAYHERMREEARTRGEGAPAGAEDDWLNRRLLAVGPQTGRLLNILAKSLDAPTILELGTSYGYSGIWLAEAARATGGRVITTELHDYKSAYARDMAEKAGLAEFVDFRVGDAVELIGGIDGGIDFVLVDLWKDMYMPCLEAFAPKLNAGAIAVADNMIHPSSDGARAYGKAIRAMPDMDSVLLPVGSGIEISRYQPA